MNEKINEIRIIKNRWKQREHVSLSTIYMVKSLPNRSHTIKL